MGLLSDDHMQWLADFTGISSFAPTRADPPPSEVAAPADAPPASAPPPNASSDDGSGSLLSKAEGAFNKVVATVKGDDPPPSGSSPHGGAPPGTSIAGLSKDFDKDLPSYTLKKIPLAGGKVTVQGTVGGKIKGKATVLDSNDTSFDVDGASVRVMSDWLGNHVATKIEGGGFFNSLKLDGLSVKGEEQTRLGLLTVELKLLGVDKEVDHDGIRVLPVFMEGEVGLSPVEIDLSGEVSAAGLQFSELKLLASLTGKIGPDAKEIIKDWLEKQAEQRATDEAKSMAEKAGEAMLEGIALDTIITGSMIVIGIAIIAGSIESIMMADELEDLGNSVARNAHSAEQGWLLGRPGRRGLATRGSRRGMLGAGRSTRKRLRRRKSRRRMRRTTR